MAENLAALLDSLTKPVVSQTDSTISLPKTNMRVAVVTSDLGLQWGDGEVGGNTVDVPTCTDVGDDAEFAIESDSSLPECENLVTGSPWLETGFIPNDDIAGPASCRVQQGTDGCEVGQPLRAMVKALENHPEFLVLSHLLVVFVVSDREDCSIESSDLFQTENWLSGTDAYLSVACNYPAENESHLFEPRHFYEQLIALKGGDPDLVPVAPEGPAEGSAACV